MKRHSMIALAFTIISLPISLLSCSEDITIISGNDGGSFKAINQSTNDTLIINDSKYLNAKPGHTIELVFEPKDDYKKYTFEKEYSLNDKKIDSIFVVRSEDFGKGTVSLYAETTQQPGINISAKTYFYLNVSE